MNEFVKAAQEHRIFLLGHQGVFVELPDNSLSGFKRAIEMGLNGVEMFIANYPSNAKRILRI